MDWDSVQELKAELRSPPQAVGLTAQELGEAPEAGRPQVLARAQPRIAFGATPTDRPGDYKFAVRVQRRDLMTSARLAAIRQRVGGEADIQYVGPGFKQSLAGRYRPLTPGWSIGHYAISAGTLGAFVSTSEGPQILSNNHVLADEDRADIGDPILQPGAFDGGRRNQDTVATLTRVIPLNRHAVNFFDAALATPLDDIEIDPTDYGELGQLVGVAEAGDVLDVAKLGRTTELTRGRITALDLDELYLGYEKGLLRFDGVIEVAGMDGAFTANGDSGSLVVTAEDQPHAIGLHFAGLEAGRSILCPLMPLLENLDAELLVG